MKKSSIIVSATILIICLSSFTVNKWNDQGEKTKKSNEPTAFTSTNFLATVNKTTVDDMTFVLDSRFIHNVTLDDIKNAKSIKDIIPKKEADLLSNYSNNTLTIMLENGEKIEKGIGEKFNSKQLSLLANINYSTDLNIKARCMNNDGFGNLDNYGLVYYMTVIPEKEATYKAGNEAFVEQVKARTRNHVAHVKMNNIKPGRVKFTVNKEGKVTKALLDSTCGYEDVDEKLVNIFNNLEGEWNPALNAQGEAVEQELYFFFGIFGC